MTTIIQDPYKQSLTGFESTSRPPNVSLMFWLLIDRSVCRNIWNGG